MMGTWDRYWIALTCMLAACASSPGATLSGPGSPPPAATEPRASPPPQSSAARSSQATLASADRYDALVAQAEAGEPINFGELRAVYLESPAYRPDGEGPEEELARLNQATSERTPDNDAIFALSNAILKTWYVSLDAHLWRATACKRLGRTDCQRYEQISRGMLVSITQGQGHDGRSCATAAPIVSIRDIFFVLVSRGLPWVAHTEPINPTCDERVATDKQGVEHRLYFDLNPMIRADFHRKQRFLRFVKALSEIDERSADQAVKQRGTNAPLPTLVEHATAALLAWQRSGTTVDLGCDKEANKAVQSNLYDRVDQFTTLLQQIVPGPDDPRIDAWLHVAQELRNPRNSPRNVLEGSVAALLTARYWIHDQHQRPTRALRQFALTDADVVNVGKTMLACAGPALEAFAASPNGLTDLTGRRQARGFAPAEGWLEAEHAALTAFLAETGRLAERVRTGDEMLALFSERKAVALHDPHSMLVISMATSLLGDDATRLLTEVRDAVREYRSLVTSH